MRRVMELQKIEPGVAETGGEVDAKREVLGRLVLHRRHKHKGASR